MQYRKLSELKKLEGNPCFIKDKKFKNLCQSIKKIPKFFEARPLILSNRTGELIVIAGNQRYEAAKKLKLTEAPTYLMEGITEEQEREITIRDNVRDGEWDFDALANSWSDLPLIEWGVPLPVSKGFDTDEEISQKKEELRHGILVTVGFLDVLIQETSEYFEDIYSFCGKYRDFSDNEKQTILEAIANGIRQRVTIKN